MIYRIRKNQKVIKGNIRLTGSKSISNRVLMIRALCKDDFPIHRLAEANDTQLMLDLLQFKSNVLDAGPAGTTYRFLTAYLALKEGTQVLTGTERMKQRPIGVLVDALRKLGASIKYLEKEGYPPLEIGEFNGAVTVNQLSISASTSSQYISALLMIAPTLPNGLELTLEGKIVSRPYIEMTLKLMQYFGVEHEWVGNLIRIKAQAYQAKPITIEADWSAASYYYGMAALGKEVALQLDGLFPNSVQGDSVLVEMMASFGIKTTFNDDGVLLTKEGNVSSEFKWDFLRCPDLAQTIAVVCGVMGIPGIFKGIETLRIKETDRVAALQTELAKVQVKLREGDSEEIFFVEEKALVEDLPAFDTYEDHRMAMAFALLAMEGDIQIKEPMVVGKSYPDFWKDIALLGFEVLN